MMPYKAPYNAFLAPASPLWLHLICASRRLKCIVFSCLDAVKIWLILTELCVDNYFVSKRNFKVFLRPFIKGIFQAFKRRIKVVRRPFGGSLKGI